MKFLKNGLGDTSKQLAGIVMLLCGLLLSGCGHIYAKAITTNSNPAKTSLINYSEKWNPPSATAGHRFAPDKRLNEPQNRFTNFTGLKTPAFSEKNLQFGYGSAVPIQNQSNLSANSIIFISANSQITRVNRCGNSLSKGILQTARRYSDANQATNSKTFARLPEINLKISPTGRRMQSFAPPFSGHEIGRTSAVFRRQKSNSPESWRRSTRGQHRFAES